MSSQAQLTAGAARRAQLHTSSFPTHASLFGDPLQIVRQTSSTHQAPLPSAQHLLTPKCLHPRGEGHLEGSSAISCLKQQQQRPGGPGQGPAPSTPASRVSPKEQLRQRASTTGDLGTLCTHMEPTRLIPVRGRHNSPASDRPRCEMGQRKACNYFKSNSSLALPTAQHAVCNHISSC